MIALRNLFNHLGLFSVGERMSEVVNPYVLLQKIDHIERELEDLKVMLLKMVAEDLPEEEIDEETLKAFEKDLKDMIEGKVEVLSADEAIKLLSEEIKD
nr:hypothetical protein [Thermococcus sp. EXT9]